MKTPLAIVVIFIYGSVAFGQVHKSNTYSVRLHLLLEESKADSVRKDYSSALKHFNQYVHLKDSLLETVKKQQISELQQRYQTVKKDLEITSKDKNITLLTGQNILINENLQQTRSIRKIIVAVIIAAALLLAISYLQYRLKKKANQRLVVMRKAIDQKNDSLQDLALQKDLLLDEKELLIKEIHHRVKNNLQVVISLLNTQSAYLHDPRALAAISQSQHRMRSISLIHQKLYQSESRALIKMSEYAQELTQYLQQSFKTGSRILFQLKIDDIELDVSRAVPVGLILNEAITNALNYAFPTDCDGCIEIELSCIDGQHLKLMVIDNGPGLPPEFNIDMCRSLGINLMKGMCEQISGKLTIQNKNGLIITIEFPQEITLTEIGPNDDISSFGDDTPILTQQ